ncbi:MAG TPA: hypothetical protein VHJ20_04260 [Polyangia bacterium]|nr:hypothetical protein [Polyangia bacterium]
MMAATAFTGCSDSGPKKGGTGGSGGGGTTGSTGGTGGDTTPTGGTGGDTTSTGGTGGTTTPTGGTGGAATGGTGGTTATGGTGGSATGGTGGTTATGGTGGDTTPPPVPAPTAVILIDNVIVAPTVVPDAGTPDGGVADAGDDAGDGGPVSQNLSYTFDTADGGVAGWHYTGYGSTPTNDPNGAENLAHTSMLVWDGTNDVNGSSSSGSLKGTVLYNVVGDQIDFQAFSSPNALYNWTGYTVTAKVKEVSGGCPLQGQIYLSQMAGYNTARSSFVDLVPGQWTTLTYNADDAMNVGGIDVTTVNQMGIAIVTGAACPTPDGGTDASTDAPTDTPVGDGGVDAPVDAPATDGGVDAPVDSAAGG